jgi:hypothetical protein
MQSAAVSLLISFAFVSQAFAVLRPLFPVKAVPPYSGEVIIIGDDLVGRLCKDNPLKHEMIAVEKPGAQIEGNAFSNWMNLIVNR